MKTDDKRVRHTLQTDDTSYTRLDLKDLVLAKNT